MSNDTAFEKLSSSLPQYERLKLLEKIRTYPDTPEQMLISTDIESNPSEKPESIYSRLPWYKRCLFCILGFFSGKKSLDMFINFQIAEIGRGIDLIHPGVFYWQKCLLRQDCQSELKKLKEASRFFYGLFDSAISRNRGSFFVFLGSFEMSKLHAQMSEKTFPSNFAAENPGFTDTKLKQLAVNYVENEINNISEHNRDVMYEDAHMLICLKQLASYLYDRLIISFNQTAGGTEFTCPVAAVRNQIMTLNNILFSIKKTPSTTLLSAMFMFLIPDKSDDADYDTEKELQKFISHAERAVEVIRTFNQRVPLTRILRCCMCDTTYMPSEISGGEDWFILFRNKWVENVSSLFNEYIKDRLRLKIQDICTTLFGDVVIEPFENVSANDDGSAIPVDNIQSISYLLAFHKLIFMPAINVFIRPILIDGDFIKKENKIEFTEAYNVLIKLDDSIKNFTNRLRLSGDLGKRWNQISVDIQSVTVRRRKAAAILEEINNTVDDIVSDAQKALMSLKNILEGILYPERNVLYDSLTNLAKISGKGTSFTEGLEQGIEKLDDIILLLKELEELQATD
jgi:hypothetical protein